jgi:hypothetical protein
MIILYSLMVYFKINKWTKFHFKKLNALFYGMEGVYIVLSSL